VRNRALHDQLRLFAGQAAETLSALVESGSEIPFEVAENPGARSVLYRYRPLSDEFVRERFPELRGLGSYPAALSALSRVEGVSAYLRVQGETYVPAAERDRSEAALARFLARVWEEASSFELEDSRFERAYRELERIAYEDTAVNTVLAPVLGVHLAGERWDLGSGISLVRGDLCPAPPEAVWAAGREGEEPNTIVALVVESTPNEPPPITAARISFRRLLTALRLFKPGSATLGATAWWRTDEGPWHAVPLGFAGRARGGRYLLEATERAELGELFELLRSRPALTGPLPWALARFELGCEHPVALEGLSDHLLTLRSLLSPTEPWGEPGEGWIARRLAALCAEPADRETVEEAVEQCFRLERLVMRGDADAGYLSAVGIDSPEGVVIELEQNLRALLRDMVCGHIESDAKCVADELLPGTGPPPVATAELQVDPPEPDFVVRRKFEDSETGDEQPTEETVAVGGPQPTSLPVEADDWGFDDDAADYSAAV
jgi:hypothetical protein